MTSFEQLRPKIDKIFKQQSEYKDVVNISSVGERKLKLRKLLNAILKNEDKIVEAIFKDYKKPFPESKLTEIFSVITEIKHTLKNLDKWVQPHRVPTPIVYLGFKSEIRYQAKGQVLIISPWNFPFLLAMGPLVSAIAAGNTIMLKPSEHSPFTTEFLIKFLGDLFNEKEVAVFYGDHLVGEYLINLPFDHIFFTGSTPIGKLVMKVASQNLTSVTLELGGKSPTIVDESADIKSAAEKICWGKFMNAGQTCIAPDYLIVHESVEDKFVSNFKSAIEKFYGPYDKIINNRDFSRIIDSKHYERIYELVSDAQKKGAELIFTSNTKNNDKFIPPMVITNVSLDMTIMKEEIFGPVLPIVTYQKEENILEIINHNPKPLALYIFSKKNSFVNKIVSNVASGGVMINNVVIHFTNTNIPFGGIGNSGVGNAHGFYGFKAFSHERAIMRQKHYSLIEILFPPYTKLVQRLIKLLIKYF
jgi:aldehyde dehydrogenase (NAD+)